MAKPIQYCKVKKYNKINIFKKKRKSQETENEPKQQRHDPKWLKQKNRTITTQENKSDQNNNSELGVPVKIMQKSQQSPL